MSKSLKIRIKSLNQFHDEMLSAMKTLDKGKKAVKTQSDPIGVIFFESQADFQKFFSPQKIEILAIIKHAKPKTIYELASIAQRQFPAVLKDVKSLANYGFVELESNEDNRKSFCPKLKFNYDEIVIEMPIRGFSVSIKAA